MKKIVSLLVFFAVLLSAGCGKAPEQKKGNDNPGEEKTNFLALYSDILNEDYGLIKNIETYDSFIDGKMGIMETAQYLKEDAFGEIGYLLKDVNGDEVPELLIGINNGDGAMMKHDLLEVYTLVDNKPVFVLEGRSRNAYALMKDNNFYNIGSNGAAYSIFGEYALEKDGTLKPKNYYFSYHKGNDYENIGFYYNTTGIYETDAAKELDITDEAFFAISDDYARNTDKLPFTPFSAYSPEGEGTAPVTPTASPKPMVPPFCGDWTCTVNAEGEKFVLLLNIPTDRSARYRVGPPESEFMADYSGEWTWDESTITFDVKDKLGSGPLKGTFAWEMNENRLILVNVSGNNLIYSQGKEPYVFYRK